MKKMYLADVCEKEIVVFGCGKWGKRCIKDLLKKGWTVIGFCDNDSEQSGNQFYNYQINSVEEIKISRKYKISLN